MRSRFTYWEQGLVAGLRWFWNVLTHLGTGLLALALVGAPVAGIVLLELPIAWVGLIAGLLFLVIFAEGAYRVWDETGAGLYGDEIMAVWGEAAVARDDALAGFLTMGRQILESGSEDDYKTWADWVCHFLREGFGPPQVSLFLTAASPGDDYKTQFRDQLADLRDLLKNRSTTIGLPDNSNPYEWLAEFTDIGAKDQADSDEAAP